MLSEFLQLVRTDSQAPVIWVDREIAVSCSSAGLDWPSLRGRGISGVIDLSQASGDIGPIVRRWGMRYLRLAVRDGALPGIEELHIVTSWARQRASEDGPVLIHEDSERGHAALLAGAVLVRQGASAPHARSQILRASELALDTPQFELLQRFAEEVQQQSRH